MSEQITLILKRGDKEIVKMEIDEDRVKATQAAALGLAAPRKKREKPDTPAPTKTGGR